MLLFVELDDASLLDEMSESELDSTSLLFCDLPEDAVLLHWSCALFCLLFLEWLVFGDNASLLDEMSESELDSTSLLLFDLLEEAVDPQIPRDGQTIPESSSCACQHHLNVA